MKKHLSAAFMLATLALGLCGCRIAGREIRFESESMSGQTVFSVNEAEASLSEAKLYLANYSNLYGTVYGMNLWSYDFGQKELEDYVKSVAIDELSRVYCMEQIAEAQGISLTDEEKRKAGMLAKDYDASLSKAEKEYIDASRADMEAYYQRYALAHKLYDQMITDEDTEVSDDEARVIRICRICLTDADRAKEVGKKLAQEEDFMTVAAIYNEADSVELTAARGVLPAEVEEVAFELDDGEISGLIRSGEEYDYVLCVSKNEEELTAENKQLILQEREREAFDAAYRSFVEQAEVTLNEGVWAKVSIMDQKDKITTHTFFSAYEEAFAGE